MRTAQFDCKELPGRIAVAAAAFPPDRHDRGRVRLFWKRALREGQFALDIVLGHGSRILIEPRRGKVANPPRTHQPEARPLSAQDQIAEHHSGGGRAGVAPFVKSGRKQDVSLPGPASDKRNRVEGHAVLGGPAPGRGFEPEGPPRKAGQFVIGREVGLPGAVARAAHQQNALSIRFVQAERAHRPFEIDEHPAGVILMVFARDQIAALLFEARDHPSAPVIKRIVGTEQQHSGLHNRAVFGRQAVNRSRFDLHHAGLFINPGAAFDGERCERYAVAIGIVLVLRPKFQRADRRDRKRNRGVKLYVHAERPADLVFPLELCGALRALRIEIRRLLRQKRFGRRAFGAPFDKRGRALVDFEIFPRRAGAVPFFNFRIDGVVLHGEFARIPPAGSACNTARLEKRHLASRRSETIRRRQPREPAADDRDARSRRTVERRIDGFASRELPVGWIHICRASHLFFLCRAFR